MQAAGLQPGSDTFDRIVDADSALVVLRSEQPEVLVEQFRQVARRSGQTVYLWHRDHGLCSLREGGVPVPCCRRVSDMLRYVLQSMHFGIYLMAGMGASLEHSEQALLHQLERVCSAPVRRVVLLTNDEALIESIECEVTVINSEVDSEHPRLRDGHWLV